LIELLAHDPTLWLVLSTLLGLCVGSFLNVLVYRFPIMMNRAWAAEASEAFDLHNPPAPSFNLLLPASHCPACQTRLAWWENIPLLSFLWLKGHCHHCHTPVSWRYPLVELTSGVAGLVLAWFYPPTLQTCGLMVFVYTLIALTLIDLDTYLLPDDITLPLLWLGLLFNLYYQWTPLNMAVLGACTGYLLLWSIYQLFKALTGKEGMGYGDFKLLAAMGAWLGVQSMFTVIFMASVFGVFFGLIIQKIRGKHHNEPFPFGPSLVVGAFTWLAGIDLSNWFYTL
jgi:leader peptidase (prepilin peptidase)/N-methyltransferase